eukprot:CAMPEP_0202908138 /NCGR_PEP_ID=MMETSP1392-20130828/45014_1 /ASSEMBLY_ACC=CAM_ASM_000868 /TAXON_ID=225041 /ORGANISM="Chlamydomonas chlamydogama, Strain SAG 11-48b" /LENGTH=204 /DNA_ID=CAMNT_0049597315 /DNA_START=290 /DNA_END=901 /DNA_ORIENTATION=+
MKGWPAAHLAVLSPDQASVLSIHVQLVTACAAQPLQATSCPAALLAHPAHLAPLLLLLLMPLAVPLTLLLLGQVAVHHPPAAAPGPAQRLFLTPSQPPSNPPHPQPPASQPAAAPLTPISPRHQAPRGQPHPPGCGTTPADTPSFPAAGRFQYPHQPAACPQYPALCSHPPRCPLPAAGTSASPQAYPPELHLARRARPPSMHQ